MKDSLLHKNHLQLVSEASAWVTFCTNVKVLQRLVRKAPRHGDCHADLAPQFPFSLPSRPDVKHVGKPDRPLRGCGESLRVLAQC